MADIIDQIADDVHALAGLSGVTYAVGKLSSEALGTYPRVIWLSPGGTISPQTEVGGRLQSPATSRRRLIRTDDMRIELHCWGSDRESARAIMHAMVSAIWEKTQGCVQFGDYEWPSEQIERGENATYGSLIVLSLMIQAPIHEGESALGTDAAEALTTISAQTHTGTYIDNATESETTVCETS